ncbi:MAG: glycoside hydrolase family 5 [Verrucomicrobiales bacterium]|nr:glycoside hydrolase family 5 [Verrucomicrobiales bacterium]
MNHLPSTSNQRPNIKSILAVLCAVLLSFGFTANAKVMENGVDPERLGTGDWIYFMSEATNHLGGNVESVTNVPSLMSFYKSMGVDFIAVKAGTGADDFPPTEPPQFNRSLVDAAHVAGIKIFGYTRSNGKNVPGEIALAARVYNLGADGFIIDAEAEWEPGTLGQHGGALAIQLCQGIKKAYPNKFLAHAPFPVISLHAEFPYKEFGLYCDAVMPQDYWKSINMTPTKMVARMDREWKAWHDSLTGSDKNAIKPLAPIGHGWNLSSTKTVTEAEIMEFVAALNHDTNAVTPGGYKGVSYWRTDLHTAEMWRGIKKARIGDPSSTPLVTSTSTVTETETALVTTPDPAPETKNETAPVIVEDPENVLLDDTSPSVTFTGEWFPGRRPEGRHGDSYKCANAVADEGTATATYHPQIPKAGPYDIFIWYNTAANRSTNALYLISGEGKTITKHVDQTMSGGDWVQLASNVPFSAGSAGFVAISNGTGEDPTHVIIADAIRFVWKGKKD